MINLYEEQVPLIEIQMLCKTYNVEFIITYSDKGHVIFHFGDKVSFGKPYFSFLDFKDYFQIVQMLACTYPDIPKENYFHVED